MKRAPRTDTAERFIPYAPHGTLLHHVAKIGIGQAEFALLHLSPSREEGLWLVRGRIGEWSQVRAHHVGKPRQDVRIDSIRLCELALGFREVADLTRTDADDGQAGRREGGDPEEFIPTCGFQDNQARRSGNRMVFATQTELSWRS